ncbi:MAG: transglycosylase SLT domain-containing protein [Bacteroidetes bacterium]|nr:transglycosylase SLT domain-containing protein [Bacteroidota bacterium]
MNKEKMNGYKKIFFLLIAINLITIRIYAQSFISDNPIAAVLDSLQTQKVFEKAFLKPIFPKNNKFKYTPDSVPVFDDYSYQARLAKLDALSPFDLVYNNHVKSFIDLYTVRKRESVSRMMGAAQLYYPMFEEVFDRYNIPLELKHLAVIESALIPYARSRAGAMGLWQFMYPTGKLYGLSVTSYIDDRCDPYKATVAAAEYLKSLYSMFGDWQMVLAAYNAGPGTITKAIRRSGGKKTYWEIRPYLPLETQGYVPAFIAANYVMSFGPEHNLYPALPRKSFFEVDTVIVKEQMHFDQIAQALDVTGDELLYFNPQYRKNIIPAGGNSMCLPKTKIGLFLTNEKDIYTAIKNQQQDKNIANVVEVKKTHIVKPGEKLSTIARMYGVSLSDLRTWNYIGRRGVHAGKKLVVYVPEQKSEAVKLDIKPESKNTQNIAQSKETINTQLAQNSKNNSVTPENTQNKKTDSINYITHKVQKGESLYSISIKYGVSTTNIKELNNLINSELQIDQYLKIKSKN